MLDIGCALDNLNQIFFSPVQQRVSVIWYYTIKLNKFSQAVEDYRRALELDENFQRAKEGLATAQKRQKQVNIFLKNHSERLYKDHIKICFLMDHNKLLWSNQIKKGIKFYGAKGSIFTNIFSSKINNELKRVGSPLVKLTQQLFYLAW